MKVLAIDFKIILFCTYSRVPNKRTPSNKRIGGHNFNILINVQGFNKRIGSQTFFEFVNEKNEIMYTFKIIFFMAKEI